MLIIGLTGSIGMGKTATAAMFREAGVPVFDADAAVHAIYAGPSAIAVEKAFPGTLVDGRIDRTRLWSRLQSAPDALRRLEAIVHPLVRAAEDAFLDNCAQTGARVVVLDVPLLLESRIDERCDIVVVVTAPADVQRIRVLERGDMSAEKFEAILAKQMPDSEKRRRAHALVPTGWGFPAARKAVADILRAFAAAPGSAYANRRQGR